MKKKVLFIDDDAGWRELALTSLQDAGYDVLLAHDATAAMEQASGSQLGLIVLDLNLAGESGLTLMRYLKRNHPDVPILLFSGIEHDDLTIRAMLDEGADQYLRKGNVESLIVTVGTYYSRPG